MQDLPQAFLEKMKVLLGGEYEKFLASYDQPRKYGLRVNTLKISPGELQELAPFHLTKIPWIENGFFYEEQDAPGRHPLYHAGLYYLQEPSAMTPASVLPVEPGNRVLDLCAAPGGKATELGAKLQGQGLLVANDISASRAKALLKNIEVCGISNAFVTTETPARLAAQFPEFFDRILVDAPCSGEGMFRKDAAAVRAWDAEKPIACAKQQREIIRRAADMLAPGGWMLYSTCTFSPEENEQIIAGLLRERMDLVLADIPPYEGFAQGIPEACREMAARGMDSASAGDAKDDAAEDMVGRTDDAAEGTVGRIDDAAENTMGRTDDVAEDAVNRDLCEELRKCVRIFPHKMEGEGHFLALLYKKRPGEQTAGEPRGNRRTPAGGKQSQEQKILQDFLRKTTLPIEEGRLEIRKGQAYYVPEGLDVQKGLAFLRNGLYLGEVKKDRFEPSQSLAMALKKEQYDAVIDLPYTDARVLKYLKGETICVEDVALPDADGWQLVCADGYPLGWGKLAGGILKNKYHSGWRMK